MIWPTIWMKSIIWGGCAAGGGIGRRTSAIAIWELRWVGRGSPRGEWAEIVELVLSEILSGRAGTGGAPALRRGRRAMLGKLMCLLLGVEHHLLISPLCELGIGIEKWAMLGDLTLLRGVHRERLLMVVLVEGGGVERLGVSIPAGLLLLDRVGIVVGLRRRNLGGRRRGIVGRRHALAGNGGVGWV
jgi:hypothetical protein